MSEIYSMAIDYEKWPDRFSFEYKQKYKK